MDWKVLSGIDNIHNEAHYVVSNIPFFLKNVEFVCSVDKYQPLSGAETIFGRGWGAENLK